MARLLPPRATVLDVGCGLGTWPRFLIERQHRVYGIDFSIPLLDRARSAARGLHVCAATAAALPFEDRSFDILLSWGVIEHDEEGPGRALKEFRRVVKPGGRILVTVPLDSPRQREAEQLTRRSASGVFYEYHFRPAELAREIERAGFGSVKADPITKSPHLIAPRVYRWLSGRSPIVRDAGIQMLKPATFGRSDCFHMVLGSGMVPPARHEAAESP